VLELVQLGEALDKVHNPIDHRAGHISITVGPRHHTHEGRTVSGDERRYTPDSVVALGGVVLLAERVERPSAGDFAEHVLGVDVLSFQHCAELLRVSEVSAAVVPESKQRPVHSEPSLR
jgi:hypothetical protein